MKANKPITSFISTLLILALAQSAMAVKVSKQEEAQWLHCVIPLPKQISIMSKVELPAAAVKIRLRQDAGEVVKTAAAELSALFKEKANVDASTGSFEILIGVCDKEGKIEGATILHADELAELPNWRQAYVIHAIDENRLVLTALDERGVYYAVQTLCQLLDTKFADGKVSMPLVTATDRLMTRSRCSVVG